MYANIIQHNQPLSIIPHGGDDTPAQGSRMVDDDEESLSPPPLLDGLVTRLPEPTLLEVLDVRQRDGGTAGLMTVVMPNCSVYQA